MLINYFLDQFISVNAVNFLSFDVGFFQNISSPRLNQILTIAYRLDD